MKKILLFASLSSSIFFPKQGIAQDQEDQLGAWYMYFFTSTIKERPWGFQGDLQYRNWNLGGDLEQLLIRGGLTYTPKKANIKFTLGAAHITSGSYGKDQSTTAEKRIYQEALFPVRFGNRFYTTHRFRIEQRFVENQDFRTRYRYNLFLNIPLNKTIMEAKTLYLQFYNELFINGQRTIGKDRTVELFDRNRLYGAIGYFPSNTLKIQVGILNQTTDFLSKNQLQLSFHQEF